MPDDEFDWEPDSTWFVEVDDEDDELLLMTLRCVEMVRRSISARSEAVRKGYIAAAQFFALAINAMVNERE